MSRIARADVVRQYQDLVAGVPRSRADARSYEFLVATTSYQEARGDIYVAAGLGRALAQRGHGVRLVGPDEWYAQRSSDVTVVVMVIQTDVRRIPSGPLTVVWIRNRVEEWVRTPGLGLYDAVFTSSELSRSAVAKVFDGPTGVCQIGVDTDLFKMAEDADPPRSLPLVATANHWGSDRVIHSAMRRLKARGVETAWFGEDRSGDPELGSLNRGMIDFFEIADLYQDATLTIDDLHHVSIGYGNLNSRLFEALACGSLVVTNGALGLREAGLEEVPVYRTEGDLEQIAERALAGAYDATTARLSEVVHEHHGYSRRAETFDELVDAAYESRELRGARSVVNFFPDYSSTNPYQTLLYSGLKAGTMAVPVADIFNVPIARASKGTATLDGEILHLHWVNGIVQPGKDLSEAYYRLDRILHELRKLKARGVRIVWTVHNAIPHEVTYRFIELELMQALGEIADTIHVIAEDTIELTRDLYDLPPEKVVSVPIPSYENWYPEFYDRKVARERLSLNDDDVSLLFFGAIRNYKGIPRLLDAFLLASQEDARLRLDVAGAVARTVGDDLVGRMRSIPRVHSHAGFIPDSHVQRYMQAADVLVLPFESILNSSSLMLGASFGVPVVAPRLGQIAELEGSGFVELYEPGNTEDLSAALLRAADTLRTPAARHAAREHSLTYAPGIVGRMFSERVIEPLILSARVMPGNSTALLKDVQSFAKEAVT